LYRDRISAKADSASVSLAPPQWPDGEVKHDPNFGEVRIFREQAVATLPLPTAGGEWTLRVRYQGCADAGLCYPPQTQTFRVSADGVHPEQGGLAGALGVRSAAAAPLMTSALLAEDESARVARKLAEDSLALTLLGFFAAGLLLALTPCMLPMVPILSGIIVGQGVSAPGAGARGRAFRLSLAYVLGMAVTYALVGVAAGWKPPKLARLARCRKKAATTQSRTRGLGREHCTHELHPGRNIGIQGTMGKGQGYAFMDAGTNDHSR
jgi:thiol:disulfide interchange protein DsbD